VAHLLDLRMATYIILRCMITYSGRAKRGIGSMTKMQKTILIALSQESRQR